MTKRAVGRIRNTGRVGRGRKRSGVRMCDADIRAMDCVVSGEMCFGRVG